MFKNAHIWLGSYIAQELKRFMRPQSLRKPTHIMFCFVDHYEPEWHNADADTQNRRVAEWVSRYPKLAQGHKDADDYYPKHTFFYPAEVYVKEHLDRLAKLCARGFGEVEIHLHHDNDTDQGLRQKLEQAKKDFTKHGLLGKNKSTGEIGFAFIHGNWALNNSGKDGRWCGINNESSILKSCGCYADFTFPSAPSETQTKIINSIYYPNGDEQKPKSHNNGIAVAVGAVHEPPLLHVISTQPIIIQGPLTLNWRKRKAGIFPRIENADVTGVNPPTPNRVDLWVDQNIGVKGKPDWIFVKVHTHGAQENNINTLLGASMDQTFSYLESQYNDGKNYVLHYVTAREMYNIIKAAEADENGNPNNFRNYSVISL